ncbi:alpha/beta fold hydrolase [Halovivax sp.]|uniref:alpha/beta hydrolase n=1 Tax=Halovivax sp. TaxID=1935978 RepID=UPI0025C19E8A|nr:alpha/beta fold hydrolase [Halovivax sp.]
MTDEPDPHGDQPDERAGVEPAEANAAVVLVHGRGARARGMLDFAEEIDRDDVHYVAPQAARGTWYPQSFTAPIESNEPHLSSALDRLATVLDDLLGEEIPPERTVLLGFSQGACLASEYAARNARRYGGLVVLSGGLIGPEGSEFEYDGSMDGTPVFLGCGDRDPHIPVERVEETALVFANRDADVEKRIYEGMGHGVIPDEIEYVRELVGDVAARD